MNQTNTWDKIILKLLLNDKNFVFKNITQVDTLFSLLFDSRKYPEIKSLIQKNDLVSLKGFDQHFSETFSEYLDVVQFADQDNKFFIATIYDSAELWQDPMILDIFPQ